MSTVTFACLSSHILFSNAASVAHLHVTQTSTINWLKFHDDHCEHLDYGAAPAIYILSLNLKKKNIFVNTQCLLSHMNKASKGFHHFQSCG